MKNAQYIDGDGVKTTPITFREEDLKLTEIINLSRQVSLHEQEIQNNKKSAKNSNLIALGALIVSILSLIVQYYKVD
ncbi:hypothetical protein SDC9_155575 [bioreactor metagenome]|uniref:Uncharacterized protein n=1 Tax=bioreactor metagenome TaxID=1076179 RepID=A0A645F738_9ZZZZ